MVYRPRLDRDEGDLLTGTRVCRICEDRKPMTDFFWTSGKKYRSRACGACWITRAKDGREQNRSAFKQRNRRRDLRMKYGLTEVGYRKLLELQDGLCAICRRELGEAPQVDHDHETGAVRGLLCFTCNTALGKFRDDVEVPRAAIEYLLRTPPDVEMRSRELTKEELSASRRGARAKVGPARTVSHSLAVRGEMSPNAVLTEANVRDILRRYAAGGITHTELAAEYGVTPSAIGRMMRAETWTHVPRNIEKDTA